MTTYLSDSYWSPTCYRCPPKLKPWLQHPGSLTQRIQQCCQQFSVQLLLQEATYIQRDEALLLGLKPNQLAWSRSVILYADNRPVVYAYSCCRLSDLRNNWQALRGLGNQPLGSLLFTHPHIQRNTLHFKQINKSHAHFNAVRHLLSIHESNLWARRSLFQHHQAPLLVTEVFLTDILSLHH